MGSVDLITTHRYKKTYKGQAEAMICQPVIVVDPLTVEDGDRPYTTLTSCDYKLVIYLHVWACYLYTCMFTLIIYPISV